MALSDILKQLGLTLGWIGAQGGMALGSAMQSQANPLAFQEQQEAMRQHQQLVQALQLHDTMTPFETAQVQQSQAQFARQQQQDQQSQGLNVWHILQGGAQPTADGGTPDFSYAGHNFSMPRPHTISKDSPIGKAIGLDTDLNGLTSDEYARYALPVMEKLSVAQDKQSILKANSSAIDAQLPTNALLIQQRFAPAYYQPLGQIDPMAASLSMNFAQRLHDASETDRKTGDMKATSAVMKDLSSFESPWEKMRQQQLTRQTEINARTAANAQSQADRSYQFHERELDALAKPVNDLAQRFSRLQATVAQNSPLSDALAMPELLSVMAGGSGSGLRMNEAEISRLVGGRSAWENLKAAAQHWSLDPSSANSITPAQRQQMHTLMDEVQKRLSAKQSALNDGYSGLASSYDPMEHRKIYDRTRKAVLDVDTTPSSNSAVDSLVQKYGGR